ncbi:MAG: AAA family ATPase, partial [Moraxella sp.]|nr:AAA family ATPase [Moraxella sp.]
MRLKSLKLAGFKSFANPTTFTFKHDITAIVGPNGCGKSNVIDAIRWVLGESSAKQLRGGAMSDVIFAGTDGKQARSMASVELTFEHTQDESTGIRHALNLYHELTLRRQISIDGKSDYFINNQKVRRRDVVDVFLGTGLSSRSYAVIEQGMIGRIIDADGEKLREFIEEAAGVSRYQARRIETQKQLDIASENLVRLTDLQSELVKQQKTLQKQAESASVYQTIKDELFQIDGKLLR